jgi:F-type H+-transporting ATPase subunit epsilon
MLVEIITPEVNVYAGEAVSVQLPGLDGSFQILNGHAPIISALQNGKVKVELAQSFEREENTSAMIQEDKSNDKLIFIDIKGGVVEMQNNKLIVLAE